MIATVLKKAGWHSGKAARPVAFLGFRMVRGTEELH